jgi:hypothetical protein
MGLTPLILVTGSKFTPKMPWGKITLGREYYNSVSFFKDIIIIIIIIYSYCIELKAMAMGVF